MSEYAERNIEETKALNDAYCKHINAMTTEDLYSKSDIAAELAWRDVQIEQLTKELEEANKWKIAVIDRAIVNWSYKKEHETDPRLAMNDVLNAEIQIALDPKISKPAKDLVDKGNAKLQAEVDRLREALGFYADEQNYHHPLNNVFCEILSDMGGLARRTLQSSDSGDSKCPYDPDCGCSESEQPCNKNRLGK